MKVKLKHLSKQGLSPMLTRQPTADSSLEKVFLIVVEIWEMQKNTFTFETEFCASYRMIDFFNNILTSASSWWLTCVNLLKCVAKINKVCISCYCIAKIQKFWRSGKISEQCEEYGCFERNWNFISMILTRFEHAMRLKVVDLTIECFIENATTLRQLSGLNF